MKLFDAVCISQNWINKGIRFYTGTPDLAHGKMWHGYWNNRLLAMRRGGILVTQRPLRYRNHDIEIPDGTIHNVETP